MTALLFDWSGPRFSAGPLSVRIRAYRPDARRRDLDNLQKPILDALKHAMVYADDSQVEHIDSRLLPKTGAHPAGALRVWVGPLIPDPGV